MKKFIAILLLLCLLCGSALAANVYDGRILFKGSNKKVGYTDVYGNEVIAAKYVSGANFHNGYAWVQISKGGYAIDQFIDVNGKVAVPPITSGKYLYGYTDWMGDYSTVEIWKKENNSIKPWGYNYVTTNGKLLNDEMYTFAGYFSEGYAVVGTTTRYYTKGHRYSSAEGHFLGSSDGQNLTDAYFFIDMDGNRLGNATWEYAKAFNEGYAAVAIQGVDGSYVYGYVNTTGNLVIPAAYSEAGFFYNGLAVVKSGESYGCINTKGETVIPFEYDYISGFMGTDGTAVVSKDDRYFYINTQGERLHEGSYINFPSNYVNGTAIVKDGVAYGVIDLEGNYVIMPAYEQITRIGDTGYFYGQEFTTPIIVNEEGRYVTLLLVDGHIPEGDELNLYPDGTPVQLMEAPMDNSWTLHKFMDMDGNSIAMNIFSEVEGENFSVAKGSGLFVVINEAGEVIGDKKWSGVNAAASSKERICVVSNNMYGFIDPEGNMAVPALYTDATAFEDGVAVVWQGSVATSIDLNGRPVLPTLSKGSKGESVKTMQRALIDQGFLSGKADGDFGGGTEKAVKAAQEAFGMEADGVADSDFQNKLLGY